METLKAAREAMATRFEIVLQGTSLPQLRAIAEEALDEIERWESRLNVYHPSSEIAQVNARAAFEPVRVSAGVFSLLLRARELWQQTDGAFDLSVGPLMRVWGFMKGNGQMPPPFVIERARELVGMDKVLLDPSNFSVQFAHQGMALDCGAIGKGWALDEAAAILRENEITSALLHGGTSTVSAIGREHGETPWRVAIEGRPPADPSTPPDTLRVVELEDNSLSVSAVWGKSFTLDGQVYGHVLDPRLGRPVIGPELAAVILPSAADTDALSTALLVGTATTALALRNTYPGIDLYFV